ncbi:Hypothetical predicted protein [Mytilus galloprovincialis]|uniref:Novel STAND NTPase 3 domain-containing protein n=1 Tax=Mytilus galloprovincialis TaxID=29158 RepID=A0A8B6G0Z8_MYTGA|nr:Hypothetical predicted protein [Mytilus galloprovincialis]
MASLSVEEENYVRMSLLLTGISPRAVRTCFDYEFAPVCLGASLKKEYNKLLDLKKNHKINQSQWNLLFPRFPGQHNQEVLEWEIDEATFFETRGTRHILSLIPSNNCIVVIGSSGCGKSSNIHHAALHLRDNFGYEIIPVLTGPTDIILYNHKNKRQVFVVDDICGIESINIQTLKNWRDNEEKIEKVFKIVEKEVKENYTDSKLLISCRLHIYKEEQFQLVKLLTRKECNLILPELCLLQKEKIQMAKKYHLEKIIDEVMKVEGNIDFFPLLCKLSKDKKSEEVLNLFTAPLDSIRKNIKHIVLESDMQCCALVLCVLYEDGFDTDWLKLTTIERKKLEDIVKEFDIDLSREMSRKSLKLGFDTLDGTYLRQRGSEYRMIHDMIHKLTAVICGQKLTACFIKYAPSVFIRDHFIFKSDTDAPVDNDVILLSGEDEEVYFERLLNDLKESIIISTIDNKQLIHQLFRDRCIRFFERSDEAKQMLKDIALKWYRNNSDRAVLNGIPIRLSFPYIMLMYSVIRGYYEIVHYLIDTLKCDMNIRFRDRMSLLCYASKFGKLDIVKLFLQKSTDLFNCEKSEVCPLYAACAEGYTDIVNLFLNHNTYQSDIARSSFVECVKEHAYKETCYFCPDSCLKPNTCHMPPYLYDEGLGCIVSRHKQNRGRDSPLHAACKRGYVDIVEILLQTNPDVNICNRFGETPLQAACKGGHLYIIKILLQTNDVVNVPYCFGETPLYVACKGGNIALVKILLKNNACVNRISPSGDTPLHAACTGGHADIVELLLQNKASVSLHAAYHGGLTAIIKDMLLQNLDNDNNFDEIEIFRALKIECKIGNIKLVELLLKKQNKLTINFCDIKNKKTLLHIACSRGHASIVKLLLKKKANISQCNSGGESPLYMACTNGHTDIVEILLQNNADVFQCKKNGETPFQVATANGHTDIVNILIQNKAG